MSDVDQIFHARLGRIPPHGLGLSVDVYSPPITELIEGLHGAGLPCDYWEVFRANHSALARVRQLLPTARLEYHAEGLWLTQPHLDRIIPLADELQVTTDHLKALGSTWMNHECASKQMAGYTFGTYLPPLLTHESAEVTAQNARSVQRKLDMACAEGPASPLLLLEVPPLTYFQYGALSVPAFFRRVTAQAPCGLVLDVGHVWTIYRYAGYGRSRSLEQFLAEFLDSFPMHRIVELHMAGLDEHPLVPLAEASRASGDPPLWIDDHTARIPEVLWEMLDQILEHPELRSLRGIALEVDSKPVRLIAEEFRRFRKQYGCWTASSTAGEVPQTVGESPFSAYQQPETEISIPCATADHVVQAYHHYSRVILGDASGEHDGPSVLDEAMLDAYRTYFRYEILEWGGRLEDMFPESCRALEAEGCSLEPFVEFWSQDPGWADREPYDFFLFKIARFLAFVERTCPPALPRARSEASQLRASYRLVTEDGPSLH